MNGRQKIATILHRRDGISWNEAYNVVEQCKEEVEWALARGDRLEAVEEIVTDFLGLEPDYLNDLLDNY